jgi:hypothetical protein
MRLSTALRIPVTRSDGPQIFDFLVHFVLDINFFSSIIYILCEGGRLRPPVVRPRFRISS